MVVDVDQIRALMAALRKIETVDISEIQWVRKGQVVSVNPELVKEFSALGLNNRDFIRFAELG